MIPALIRFTLLWSLPPVSPPVSRFMSLQPGDVVATGTPPGVGLGMNPPQYLAAGDVVELGIHGLGRQRQSVVRAGS